MDTLFKTGLLALEAAQESVVEAQEALDRARRHRNDLIIDALDSGITYTKLQKILKLSRAALIKINETHGSAL